MEHAQCTSLKEGRHQNETCGTSRTVLQGSMPRVDVSIERIKKALYMWFLDVWVMNVPKESYRIIGRKISGQSEAVNIKEIEKWLPAQWLEVSVKFPSVETF